MYMPIGIDPVVDSTNGARTPGIATSAR